jgi:hypothetical protein
MTEEQQIRQKVPKAPIELEEARRERIISLDEFVKMGANAFPILFSKTIEEAEDRFVDWLITNRLRFEKRIIVFKRDKINKVVIFYFPMFKPNFRISIVNNTINILSADKDCLIYVVTNDFIYFNTYKPRQS